MDNTPSQIDIQTDNTTALGFESKNLQPQSTESTAFKFGGYAINWTENCSATIGEKAMATRPQLEKVLLCSSSQ